MAGKKNMTANTAVLGAEAHSQLIKRERKANNVWNKLREIRLR